MKRITLPLKQGYYTPIMAEIIRILNEVIYRPLLRSVKKAEVENEKGDPLTEAIKEGAVYIEDGVIRGKFSAKISKRIRELGGVYSPRKNGWVISAASIPHEVLMAQATADSRFRAVVNEMIQSIELMSYQTDEFVKPLTDKYEKSIEWMEKDFRQAAQKITIPPTLTPAQTKMIAKEWATNLDLYIQQFADESILSLRQKVSTNAFEGRRAADLVKVIQDSYNVSLNKAKFLARQETSLLMASYHESRYRDIGSTEYIWGSSGDERERKDHRDLNGQKFSWSSPPVTNRRTGAKNHPGQDYGCRCWPIALIP